MTTHGNPNVIVLENDMTKAFHRRARKIFDQAQEVAPGSEWKVVKVGDESITCNRSTGVSRIADVLMRAVGVQPQGGGVRATT